MTVVSAVCAPRAEQMDFDPILFTYTAEQAEWANQVFDDAVRQFLHGWIDQNTHSGTVKSPDFDQDAHDFVENGALRVYFKHHSDALEQLLEQPELACHLLRPASEVYFQPDAYEPLLSKFERRIYNLSAHREHLEISFRYSPTSRQGTYGDSVGLADMPPGEAREDIGLYFGTRRSDATALHVLGEQLRREVTLTPATLLPVQIITEGYMEDALRSIRQNTEHLRETGDERLHCFIVQRRHAPDDRHLGTALLLMDPARPGDPERILFGDTLNPNGRPPWWDKFRRYVDTVFPQPADQMSPSERVEDGGVKLQRLHDGVPVRHQDIDCAFYTASMASALIRIAQEAPHLLIHGSIESIVEQMTAWMPDYFDRPNQPKAPEVVRETNILRRWQTGWQALMAIRQAHPPRAVASSPKTPVFVAIDELAGVDTRSII